MNAKNIWAIVKNRYRLSTKIQMNFELSFPEYLIGKCCAATNNAHEIKTKKISLSKQGIIFSDTMPLSWFTSSALIPWTQVLSLTTSETRSLIDGVLNTPSSSTEYCILELNDPQDMAIELPWSKEFTDYVQKNKLISI